MAEEQSREEKMGLIQQKLEDGVKEIFSSEKYKDYIRAISKFPNYSTNNCILIVSQCPNASLVCGYRQWQTDFNRTVNKGEHGIMIMAPITGKKQIWQEMTDENNNPIRDKEGNLKTELVMKEYKTFRPVYVFDLSQTSGDPIPTLVTMLDGTVDSFDRLKDVLMEVSPVPITFERIERGANGYYSPSQQKIVVEESLPQKQMIKTMIHEISHAMLGHGGENDKWDKSTKELQAESVSYWVMQLLNLDSSDYSFGYISGYSKTKDASQLRENLGIIKETADKLSESIEKALKKYMERTDDVEKIGNPGNEAGYAMPGSNPSIEPKSKSISGQIRRRRHHR